MHCVQNAIKLAAFAALLCVVTATDLGCSPAPYSFWWNVGGSLKTLPVTQFLVHDGDETQTGGGCTTKGCKSWAQGRWPVLRDGKPINGGVPQNSNLTAHLEYIKENLPLWLPDPDYDGNAVLDFESYTPIWEQNESPGCSWHGSCYQEYSISLVKAEHPDWNATQIEAEAKAQFEKAAMQFFVETLNTCRSIRPKARWGFYGIPENYYYPCVPKAGSYPQCGYNSPIIGPLYQAYNDRLQPLYDASSAIYPSIYIPAHTEPSDNKGYIQANIQESMRVAAVSAKHQGRAVPVFGFHWNLYHNGTTLLSLEDLQSALSIPYEFGAAGVVIWGAGRLDGLEDYVQQHMGPMASELVKSTCSCSEKYCHLHGRCASFNSTDCDCYPGYSGPSCS